MKRIKPTFLIFGIVCLLVSKVAVAQSTSTPTHGVLFSIEPKLDGHTIRLESFSLGARGILWIGARVLSDDGKNDSGHLFAYDPNGLLFASQAISIIPEAMNFSTRGWLYAASKDRIVRMSLSGGIEVELATEKLYRDSSIHTPAMIARPAIAGTENAIVVAYPDANANRYHVWRLSPDLSIESRIISELEACSDLVDIQTDGTNLLVTESARNQVGIYNLDGKRLRGVQRSASTESGLTRTCNPAAVQPISDTQIILGERSSGSILKFNHDSTLVSTIASLPVNDATRRISIAYDDVRNWYYWMDGTRNAIDVLVPVEELPDDSQK